MTVELGAWMAKLANRWKDQQSERSAQQTLAWVDDWVDTQEGAYRALGAPYGDDDGLLRWLKERDSLGVQ
jgi:hypothetical protein